MFSAGGFIKLVILTGILETFYCNTYNKFTGTKTKTCIERSQNTCIERSRNKKSKDKSAFRSVKAKPFGFRQKTFFLLIDF